jgi:exonuclease III
MKRAIVSLAALCAWTTCCLAEPTTIVSWNIGPGLEESMLDRQADFAGLDAELAPDVIVMVEVIGRTGAEIVAKHLGWSEYHVAVSDLSVPNTAAHEGLEVAVISRIPMIRVTEYDVKLDGRTHQVFGSLGTLPVTEELLTSSGLSQVQPTGGNDRGTLRVDLANGLTIIPVHLKSNINNACSDAVDAKRSLQNMAIDVPAKLTTSIAEGFARQVDADKRNAAERERVMAAVKVVADKANAEGRTTIIAGDFNTSFEQGKAGSAFADCDLQPFECKKAPFPAAACAAGDGFDDTFAILTTPLIGAGKLALLTEGLGRTYEDTAFADAAIDHIAVPAGDQDKFKAPSLGCNAAASLGQTQWAARACQLHGSDHFAIVTEYDL